MKRAIYKTVLYYYPNDEDMKICSACRNGWAIYKNDIFGCYMHDINSKTLSVICRSVNDIKQIKPWRHHMIAEAA